MKTSSRQQFNASFSIEKYQQQLENIAKDFNYAPTFRIAETPVFIDEKLKSQLFEACNQIIDFIKKPDFNLNTKQALTYNFEVPNEDPHTNFLAVDFGICEENGEIVPKLIEVQGFPSLYNFQHNLFDKFVEIYPFLNNYTPFLTHQNKTDYVNFLRETVVGNEDPKHVILLEIEPEKQNTRIDFCYAEKELGIAIVCVTSVFENGNQLFYKNNQGEDIQIKRIYNRVIFDELNLRTDLNLKFDFQKPYDIKWIGHPNWFFRISKFILPDLQGRYFIETTRISDLTTMPEDLENYVLKPLFSFSGTGVVFHVKKEDIENVVDKELYILQKKVHYKPIIQSPDGLVKTEIRMLYVWKDEDENPTPVLTLARMSRGEMIGVKFNKDKEWGVGTMGLFEKG
jgi:hypothetical protein